MSNDGKAEKVSVTLGIIREGWAYLQSGEKEPDADMLPAILDRAINDWLRERKDIKVRAALPIQRNGHTIAIHIWYDS